MKYYSDANKVYWFKNNAFKYLMLLTFFFGISIFSCKHDIQQTEEIPLYEVILSVDEAQQWFERQTDSTITLKSTRIGKPMKLKSDWQHAHGTQNDTLGVVNVDILSMGRFGFLDADGKRAMESSGNEKYLNSLSRLIVRKNSRSGHIESFVMTMIASPEYLETHNFDLTNNTYLNRQRDFTGLVLYHSVSGEFVNGWNFAQGKVVGKCSQVEANISPLILKSAVCLVVTVTLYNQFCTDWYDNGGRFTYTNCEQRTMEDEFYYLSCLYEPYETANGGGGYDGDYVPPVPVALPCPGDPILNPKIASSGASGVAGGTFGCVRIGESPQCNKEKKYHDGIDIECPVNHDVYSMYSGVVVDRNDNFSPGGYAVDSYGNYVTIKYTGPDGESFKVKYNHLNSVGLKLNDNVTMGQVIGKSGKTGNAAKKGIIPHIHIQVFENNLSVDPIGYFATLFNANGTVMNACY